MSRSVHDDSARSMSRERRRSTQSLDASAHNMPSPPRMSAARTSGSPNPEVLTNDNNSAEMLVTTPAVESNISVSTMLRRTGWFTMSSDSVVVKPTPENAD